MGGDYHPDAFKSLWCLGRTMERRTLLVICCLAIAIPGTLLLVSMVREPEPIEVGPGELEGLAHGTHVAVTGLIGPDGVWEGHGFAAAELVGEDGSDVQVFFTFVPEGLRPGDEVRLVGELAMHDGSAEVRIVSRDCVQVLIANPSPPMELARVLESPWSIGDLEPEVTVRVLQGPQATASGVWWCVVAGVGKDETCVEVAVLLPPGARLEDWYQGCQLELRASVGYDASRGLVYLEAVSWIVLG
jgi:hypothetical protein